MSGVPPGVLLVDDNRANLLAMRAVLDRSGYRVLAATSGAEALEIAGTDAELAVVLLDVNMPEMDGLEVARRLKASEKTKFLPVIFVTATEIYAQHVFDAYSVGGVDYLIKPVEPAVVRAKVATFVELFQQRKTIEDQARREHELRVKELRVASDERYRKLVDGIDHVVAWSADPDTLRLTFISRQAERVLGLSTDELSRGSLIERVHPDDQTLLRDAIRRTLAGNGDQACNHRMVAGDGRILWFHTGLSVVRSLDGESQELHGVSADITEIKRAEWIQEFLANASAAFAECLDVDPLIDRLARLTVPSLADWCIMACGVLSRPRAFHPDPVFQDEITDALRRVGACPPLLAEVIESGRSVVNGGAPVHEWATRLLGVDSEELRHVAVVSWMVVPLRAREKTMGAVAYFAAPPRPRFDARDLTLVDNLAHRAALAIDNARLVQEAHDLTRTVAAFAHAAQKEVVDLLLDLLAPLQAMRPDTAELQQTVQEAIVKVRRCAAGLQERPPR
jgi:PAS domain S-box-containing protein